MTTTVSRVKPSKAMETAQQVFGVVLPAIICTLAALFIWQVLCASDSSKLPAPLKIMQQVGPDLAASFGEGGVGLQLIESLKRVGVGYTLSAVVGVAVGVLIGANRFLRLGFDPMIQILRTVPPLAWLPISLAIFQDGKPAAVFLIFITAIWPIILNTAVGVQSIPSDYVNVSRVLQLKPAEYLFNILIPSTVPYIFTGLRIGIGLAWLAIVAAEMLASGAGGIGFYIWDAYNAGNSNSMSQIILAVFLVGVVGLILDRLVGWLGTLVASEH